MAVGNASNSRVLPLLAAGLYLVGGRSSPPSDTFRESAVTWVHTETLDVGVEVPPRPASGTAKDLIRRHGRAATVLVGVAGDPGRLARDVPTSGCPRPTLNYGWSTRIAVSSLVSTNAQVSEPLSLETPSERSGG